jgi:hypothetical protein
LCAGTSSRTRDLRNFAWIDDGAAQTSAASMSPPCSCPPTPLLPLRRYCRWRCARALPDLGPTSPMCRLPSPPLGRVAGTGALAYRPLIPPHSRCAARPRFHPRRAATAVGDASKCSSNGGALAGLFIWSALAPSPTIVLPLECTVGAISFYGTPLKDGRGRDGGNG